MLLHAGGILPPPVIDGDEKRGRPVQWELVLKKHTAPITLKQIMFLSGIFNMDYPEASELLTEATEKGEVVLECSTREVVEQRVEQADLAFNVYLSQYPLPRDVTLFVRKKDSSPSP